MRKMIGRGRIMTAAVLEAPYRFRLEERSLPTLDSGWLLVKVHATGICGSDIHFYTGELPLDPHSVRGHEIAGVIADQGESELPLGQPVVIHPLVGCGECPACQRGEQQLCVTLQFIGGQYPGGFANYVAAPTQNVYPFNVDVLPFEHAALADCVAVAVHAVNKIGLSNGESVVLLGDGAIALCLLQVVLACGANPVIVIGKHDLNLQIARRLGASLALEGITRDPLPMVRDAVGQVDVVFEAVGGTSPPLGVGLKMLRKGGRLATLGLTGATGIEVPWLDLVLAELSLIGVMGYGTFEGQDEMQQALDLMQSRRITLEPVITHRVSLEEVGRGFQMILDRIKTRSIKVVVCPEE